MQVKKKLDRVAKEALKEGKAVAAAEAEMKASGSGGHEGWWWWRCCVVVVRRPFARIGPSPPAPSLVPLWYWHRCCCWWCVCLQVLSDELSSLKETNGALTQRCREETRLRLKEHETRVAGEEGEEQEEQQRGKQHWHNRHHDDGGGITKRPAHGLSPHHHRDADDHHSRAAAEDKLATLQARLALLLRKLEAEESAAAAARENSRAFEEKISAQAGKVSRAPGGKWRAQRGTGAGGSRRQEAAGSARAPTFHCHCYQSSPADH